MKLRDAMARSIRSYMQGNLPEKAIEASKSDFVYTLDYFEELKELTEKEEGDNEPSDA